MSNSDDPDGTGLAPSRWRDLPFALGYGGLLLVMAIKIMVDLGWWP